MSAITNREGLWHLQTGDQHYNLAPLTKGTSTARVPPDFDLQASRARPRERRWQMDSRGRTDLAARRDTQQKTARAKTQRRRAAARAVVRALTEVAVRCRIYGVHPHRLRRTYALEYLKGLVGDPDALMMPKQHMQWESLATAVEYVDHARGQELDDAAEKIFLR